ncbi:MAG: SdrD B-like domain-containing protein, partial [Methanocella sp.]
MKINKAATALIILLVLLALITPSVSAMSSMSTQTGVSDKHAVNGFKFNDINGNGIRDPGEPGIPNVVVELFNSTNILVAQTTTDQTGFYEFRHLGVGSYTVQEIVPTGYLNTTPTSLAVAIAPKTSIVNVNFGNAQPATIEGLKYHDLNKNGLYDPREPGLPGWAIDLANTSGPVGTTVTGASGAFQFNNLRPGQYTISEVLQSGFTNTSPLSMMVTVTSGQVLNVTTSFGLFGNIPAVKFAYVTNAGSNSVSVIDTSTNTVVGSPIPVGGAPVDVAITPDGTRVYVTNQASASVSVIDTST